jgi:hypothetical protein
MIKEDDVVQLTVQYAIGHQLALVAGPNNNPLKQRFLKPGTVLRVLAVRNDGMALCSTRLSPPRFWGTVFPVQVVHLTKPNEGTTQNKPEVL